MPTTLPDIPRNRVTGEIVDAAIKVHTILGPGLLEAIYTECLVRELTARGLEVQRELSIPVVYEGQLLGLSFRIDLLVAREVVVEVKAISSLLPVHEAQVRSYLRLSGCRIGMLLNFHALSMKDGIRRLEPLRAGVAPRDAATA